MHGTSSRIRICHCSLSLCTGGLERLLVDFARFHDSERFELLFVSLSGLGRPAEEIRALGGRVHALPDCRGRPWKQFRALCGLLQDVKPDLLHTHNAYPHFYGTLAGRWCGVPAIVNTRHGQRYKQNWKGRMQFRFASRLADRLVAVSDDAARLTISEDGIPARKVLRIWNGIDTSRFQRASAAARSPEAGRHDPVAISVGRLSPEKDVATLLRAVDLARGALPRLHLKIVGDGAERPRLERLAAELNLGGRVEFLGERSDIPRLLSAADFYVTSSLTEGISLTLLEAMAVGLPVLATAVGGNPEVVQEGRTGFLVPPGDPEALAAGLVRLGSLDALWSELGSAGRARVVEHFDVRRMVAEYEALYEGLIDGKRPRRTPESRGCAAMPGGTVAERAAV